MLLQSHDEDWFLGRAFGVSLAVHALVALLFPLFPANVPPGPEAVETLSFAHIAHVHIERHADRRPLPVAMPVTKRRSPRVTFQRKHTELSAKNRNPITRPTAMAGPQGIVAAAPQVVPQRQSAPLIVRAPGTQPPRDQTLQHRPGPSPNPQGTSDVAMTGAGLTDRGGVSPFGAEQPPILDPRVKNSLKQLNVHVTLLVTVDEDGHTKKIEYHPPLDTQMQHAIETLLTKATWDAGVCGGGVSCESIATIKL
jgi:hypothetical protein